MSNGELDFTVGFDSFSGVFNYGLQSYAQIYQHSDQPVGAYGSSVLDSRLLGIDAVDAQGPCDRECVLRLLRQRHPRPDCDTRTG